MYSIGADIGGSHITASLFEHSNKRILVDSTVSRKVNAKGSREEILSNWANVLGAVKKQTSENIAGVGLAMPGPFDYYNGICKIKDVDKLEALFNVNIRNELAKRLELVPDQIRFINDASAFAIAESLVGEASNYSRCVGITLGTGFGSSFIDDGMPVISGDNIPSGGFLYDKEYNGAIADEVFSTRGLINSFYKHSGEKCGSVLEISFRATNNELAEETFLQFGKSLGDFLLPHLEKFNAEILVLGGNISKSYPLFQNSLQEKLPGIRIYVSDNGEKAAMIGGARLLDDSYYNKLQETLKIM